MSDARLIVPPIDEEPWPTLGPELCDWIEAELVHGPGDVLGQRVELTEEVRLFLWRLYEVFPRKHPQAGRRRWKRAVFSRRKGVGKTEIAAWLAIAEMDPTAPVRCDGWNAQGDPVGRPVRDPYIPMVATTEEQTEDLAYGAVVAILENCDLGHTYDVGLERVMHAHAPGRIRPLAGAPSAREGARTSFQHFDETHLFTATRLRNAHAAMQRNIPKRLEADAWSLETTTMYAPGEDSVAEGSHKYAEAILEGRLQDARLLFDHRQASELHDITTEEGLRTAIREASGDAWAFTDVESIVSQFHDPQNEENDLRRYWLNQARRRARVWIPDVKWDRAQARIEVPPKSEIALGFKGTYDSRAAALVGCTPEGHVFEVATWEEPENEAFQVPRGEVQARVAKAMRTWRVRRLAWDPPGWHEDGERWAETYGEKVAVRFETRKTASFAAACGKFYTAATTGALTHDGSKVIARHLRDATVKEHAEGNYITAGENVIVAAVAAVLAYDQGVALAGRPAKNRRLRVW